MEYFIDYRKIDGKRECRIVSGGTRQLEIPVGQDKAFIEQLIGDFFYPKVEERKIEDGIVRYGPYQDEESGKKKIDELLG